MMPGLADYLPIPACPYPDIVQEWAAISDQQVATFTPPGFVQGDCFRGLGDVVGGWNFSTPQMISADGRGLGDDSTAITIGSTSINLISPSGFFQGDVSTWGIAEWGTVALGIYAVSSLIGDAKTHARKARKAARAYRSAS
jgi:hypothetical protein